MQYLLFESNTPVNLPPSIRIALSDHNGTLTMGDIAALGYSRAAASRWTRLGLLERVAHGLYRLPGELPDTLHILLSRHPHLVASHGTALFLCGLAETAPERWTVTAPHGHEPPASVRAACQCFYAVPERLAVGLCRRRTPFGNEVPCHDAERALCDILRHRRRLDPELVVAALRNWAASPERDPARLARHASALGVADLVKSHVEALL
jgi:predicted transcriptional regulator of viral defense system